MTYNELISGDVSVIIMIVGSKEDTEADKQGDMVPQ